MGVISSSKRGKFVDLSSLSVSIFAFSVPSFWIGLILLYFFSIQNHWFPRSLGEATGSGVGGCPNCCGISSLLPSLFVGGDSAYNCADLHQLWWLHAHYEEHHERHTH